MPYPSANGLFLVKRVFRTKIHLRVQGKKKKAVTPIMPISLPFSNLYSFKQ